MAEATMELQSIFGRRLSSVYPLTVVAAWILPVTARSAATSTLPQIFPAHGARGGVRTMRIDVRSGDDSGGKLKQFTGVLFSHQQPDSRQKHGTYTLRHEGIVVIC